MPCYVIPQARESLNAGFRVNFITANKQVFSNLSNFIESDRDILSFKTHTEITKHLCEIPT